mgnify:CR=1 FL=1
MPQPIMIEDADGHLLMGRSTTMVEGSGTVSIGATTTVILAANNNRRFAHIMNDSNEVIYLGLGEAAVLNSGIRLNALGGSFTIDATNLFTGAVNGISTSGSKVATFVEA